MDPEKLVMVYEVSIIDNFLTDDECDFLIDYFKKSQHHEDYRGTTVIRLEDTSVFNLKNLTYVLNIHIR